MGGEITKREKKIHGGGGTEEVEEEEGETGRARRRDRQFSISVSEVG